MIDIQIIDWALSKMVYVHENEAPMHHDALHAVTLPVLICGCAKVHACAAWYIALYSMKCEMCNEITCVLTLPCDAAKLYHEALCKFTPMICRCKACRRLC